MSSVPKHLIEKGKIDVREDDNRREQSLKQFREWIAKHPFIKNCKTGAKNCNTLILIAIKTKL